MHVWCVESEGYSNDNGKRGHGVGLLFTAVYVVLKRLQLHQVQSGRIGEEGEKEKKCLKKCSSFQLCLKTRCEKDNHEQQEKCSSFHPLEVYRLSYQAYITKVVHVVCSTRFAVKLIQFLQSAKENGGGLLCTCVQL